MPLNNEVSTPYDTTLKLASNPHYIVRKKPDKYGHNGRSAGPRAARDIASSNMEMSLYSLTLARSEPFNILLLVFLSITAIAAIENVPFAG